MRRGIAQVCCAVVALQVAAASVRADALRRPALHWSRGEGAETCIDPRRLAQRVEAITGPVFVSATSADSSIEAHVEHKAPNVFSVRVATANAAGATLGSRTLEFRAASCREIDAAVALVIAVTIDPALGADGLPEEVLGISDTEEAPEPALLAQLQQQPHIIAAPRVTKAAPIHEPPPSAPPPERAPRPWQIDLEAALAWGAAPTLAAGLLAAGSLALSRSVDFLVQLQAATGLGSQSIDEKRSVSGGSLGLGVLACPRWALSQRFALRGCGGAFGGVAIASGHGFTDDQVGVLPRYGAVVRLDATLELSGSWQLIAAAAVTLDLATGKFVYRDDPGSPEQAYAPATLALQIGLGLGLRF
ncbi:MAG TPA: hypothetical protein VJV78_10710 [Polyangiales bacterium]|nr:hypothetical protein [Polyangiales bacterium]